MTKEHLDQLIADQIEESGVLEYKAAPSLDRTNAAKTEITKDVSAFANAAGGVLIYGIAEYGEPLKKHFPERYDPVNQSIYSREWLDQIIGQIRPRIEALRIIPVYVGPGAADYCYAVEIPQSGTAHQALDFRYYKRRNFESSPMEDYEVRDVMNRRRDPKLEVRLNLVLIRDVWYLNVTAINTSSVIARYVQVVVDMPPVLNRRAITGCDHPGAHVVRSDGLRSFEIRLRNNIDRPLFAGDRKKWTVEIRQSLGLGMAPEWTERPLKRFWYRAFADQMPMIERELLPTDVVEPSYPSLNVDILAGQADVTAAP